MEKVTMQDGESANIVNDNILKLKEIFPEAFSEGSDGKTVVQFDTLKQLLGDEKVIEEGEEKFGLNWHGKKKALQIALTPSTGTLLPCPEESVDWKTTKNLFIEGDNLEVLKLLQKSYANKVKMIYIDPPYNTGKEFIYPDKYQDNLDTYLKYTGQIDDEGMKFSSNTEISGRKHTNWLNMMYPRLKLAKNLLSKDGVIFVSIDDNEVANLREICDQIFGEENFIGLFIINSSPSAIDYGHIAKTHDYAIFYSKNSLYTKTSQLEDENKVFKYKDEKGEFNLYPLYNGNVAFNPETRPNLFYPFYLNPQKQDKNGFYEISVDKVEGWETVYPVVSQKDGIQRVWRWGKPKSRENINGEIVGYKSESGEYRIVQKTRLTGKLIRSLHLDTAVSSRRGTAEIQELFERKVFTFPKPVELIKRFTQVASEKDSIVLDFFSGSSPTAHAILKLNKEDNGNRKFVMVQLPEPCDDKSEAFKAGYVNIANIGKERIRRATKKIKEENPDYNGDLGFKVFKLAQSNIKVWNPDRNDIEETLNQNIEHIIEGRTDQDVLYELLLKRGVDLTTPIEQKEFSGKAVYSIGYGVLFACLEEKIEKGDVEELTQGIIGWYKELEPEIDPYVFFRDSAFADDITKTNIAAILEQNGIKHVKSL